MHIFFAAGRQREGRGEDMGAADTAHASAAAGQLLVLRDPDDESEWQYLGNPQIAATTSLAEVVERFLKDCGGSEGRLDPNCRKRASEVRDALLAAARQIDDALGT